MPDVHDRDAERVERDAQKELDALVRAGARELGLDALHRDGEHALPPLHPHMHPRRSRRHNGRRRAGVRRHMRRLRTARANVRAARRRLLIFETEPLGQRARGAHGQRHRAHHRIETHEVRPGLGLISA